MADDQLINQEDIDQLLQRAKQEVAATGTTAAAGAAAEAAAPPAAGTAAALVEPHGKEEGRPAAGTTPEKPATAARAAPASDDDTKLLAQDDIEKLLREAGKSPAPPPPPPARQQTTPSLMAGEGTISPNDIELLLHQAEAALQSIDAPGQDVPSGIKEFPLEQFTGAPASSETATLDLIRDVDLDLRIELGRTQMYLEDVLKLRKGSVVPLDKLAGDPVDVYVNGRLIARGEVLVLNDNFCVRVAELIAGTSVFN